MPDRHRGRRRVNLAVLVMIAATAALRALKIGIGIAVEKVGNVQIATILVRTRDMQTRQRCVRNLFQTLRHCAQRRTTRS